MLSKLLHRLHLGAVVRVAPVVQHHQPPERRRVARQRLPRRRLVEHPRPRHRQLRQPRQRAQRRQHRSVHRGLPQVEVAQRPRQAPRVARERRGGDLGAAQVEVLQRGAAAEQRLQEAVAEGRAARQVQVAEARVGAHQGLHGGGGDVPRVLEVEVAQLRELGGREAAVGDGGGAQAQGLELGAEDGDGQQRVVVEGRALRAQVRQGGDARDEDGEGAGGELGAVRGEEVAQLAEGAQRLGGGGGL